MMITQSFGVSCLTTGPTRIMGALSGKSKETLLSTRFSPLGEAWPASKLSQQIDEVAAGWILLY